jgi:hypothetical protein
MQRARREHLEELDSIATPVGNNAGGACVELLNGSYVDVIHDFSSFWSDSERLLKNGWSL